MPLNFAITTDIEQLIHNIEREYRCNQGLILTEDDLAGLIYGRLRYFFRNPSTAYGSGLHWCMHTQDHKIAASPVHLEVPWYDSEGYLRIRPDITILEPDQLSILHRYGDGLKLPSKQFEFAGNAIIMELKFVRQKAGITENIMKDIRNDFNKIQDSLIGQRNTNLRKNLYCFFVVFNKTDKKCASFDQYLVDHGEGAWYKYIYCSGQVSFEN
jgi:hypothetical protein